jgi:hypothetical protein
MAAFTAYLFFLFADASWLCVLNVRIALRVMFFIYVRVCMCV